MSRLIWDAIGEKFYEMGTKMGVLYPMKEDGSYENGVAWNGLTAVTESPSGAEETKLYADDIKYASLRSAEEYAYTIEAYTYPEEWEPCDGSAQVATGVTIGQQKRKGFGFSWECSTSPVNVSGFRPTSHMEIDCSKLKADTVKAIEDKLWGTENAEATLPTPAEIITLVTTSEAAAA